MNMLAQAVVVLLLLTGCANRVAYDSDRNMANMTADQLERELRK